MLSTLGLRNSRHAPPTRPSSGPAPRCEPTASGTEPRWARPPTERQGCHHLDAPRATATGPTDPTSHYAGPSSTGAGPRACPTGSGSRVPRPWPLGSPCRSSPRSRAAPAQILRTAATWSVSNPVSDRDRRCGALRSRGCSGGAAGLRHVVTPLAMAIGQRRQKRPEVTKQGLGLALGA